jgi:hypothetical protein
VDARQRQDLDRYITGNYGEDQFKGMASVDAGTSVHFDYCERPNAYYDPADDGPEVETIISIRINHEPIKFAIERATVFIPQDDAYPEAAL